MVPWVIVTVTICGCGCRCGSRRVLLLLLLLVLLLLLLLHKGEVCKTSVGVVIIESSPQLPLPVVALPAFDSKFMSCLLLCLLQFGQGVESLAGELS